MQRRITRTVCNGWMRAEPHGTNETHLEQNGTTRWGHDIRLLSDGKNDRDQDEETGGNEERSPETMIPSQKGG